MRKPVTFRLDHALIERARQRAVSENRTLTNFVETAVLRALQLSGFAADLPLAAKPQPRADLEDANT